MSAPELTQTRCPDAYTLLAFGVGSLIGAAWVGHKLVYPYRLHAFHRPR